MNPNYFTEQNIYHAAFILLSSWLLWAILWGRGWKKKKIKAEESLKELRGEYNTGRWMQRKTIDEMEQALSEKDRVIDDVLKANNAAQAKSAFAEACLKRDISILCDILTRVHPYYRIARNDPAKMEKWLEKLKGKRAGRVRVSNLPPMPQESKGTW